MVIAVLHENTSEVPSVFPKVYMFGGEGRVCGVCEGRV